MTVKIRTIESGYAVVITETGNELGSVELIDWPIEHNGIVKVKQMWEARRPHEQLVNSPFNFPTFRTRLEAAKYLASVLE